MMCTVVLLLTLAQAPSPAEQGPAVKTPAPTAAPAATLTTAPVVDPKVLSDVPPPSTYDLMQKSEHQVTSEDSAMLWQLGRTLLSLAFVVALIYLLVRIGLPRLVRMRHMSGNGTLRIVERVQLDQRHTVLLVEVQGTQTYLLGTGDHGVNLIARVDANAKTSGEVYEQG